KAKRAYVFRHPRMAEHIRPFRFSSDREPAVSDDRRLAVLTPPRLASALRRPARRPRSAVRQFAPAPHAADAIDARRWRTGHAADEPPARAAPAPRASPGRRRRGPTASAPSAASPRPVRPRGGAATTTVRPTAAVRRSIADVAARCAAPRPP